MNAKDREPRFDIVLHRRKIGVENHHVGQVHPVERFAFDSQACRIWHWVVDPLQE